MEEKILRIIQLMQELGITLEELTDYLEKEKIKKASVVIRDSSLREEILDIVMNNLGLSADEITDDSSFFKELGADSLDFVEIVMDVEKEFKITIPDDEVEKLETFADLVAKVDEYLQKK